MVSVFILIKPKGSLWGSIIFSIEHCRNHRRTPHHETAIEPEDLRACDNDCPPFIILANLGHEKIAFVVVTKILKGS